MSSGPVDLDTSDDRLLASQLSDDLLLEGEVPMLIMKPVFSSSLPLSGLHYKHKTIVMMIIKATPQFGASL